MSDRIEIKAALAVSDAGEITGTAWPFGSADRVGDMIEKGAFSGPATVPMLFAHDHAQVVGVWEEITETDTGLTVKGRLLVDDVERAREVRAMIKAGAIGGLSIGFVTKDAQRQGRGRKITALELHEISIVAVPCHPDAKITSIKQVSDFLGETMSHNSSYVSKEAEEAQIDVKAFNEVKARLDAFEAKSARIAVTGVGTGPMTSTEVKAFGGYLRQGEQRLEENERKALNVSTNAEGGYLAPAEYGSELVKLLTEFSPVRQFARVMQVSAPEIIMPRRVTGSAAVWTAEGADMTESEPTFEQLKIANHELSTFIPVSNKLLEDNAYNLEAELMTDFAEAFAKAEGSAFLKGTGTAQPRGLLTATGIKSVKTGAAAAFPSANPADVLIGMYHEIATSHAHNAVWLMNRKTLAEVRKWKDGQGRYLVIDPQDGAPAQLLGRPIVEMPDMDNIAANAFPIMFGDLGGFRIVDRVGVSILRDPFTLGSKSQVRFIARKRVGADVTHPDRFVKLQVAA